jgi:aminopeptidase
MSSSNERLARYAELLIDRCVGVQPGWQVLVRAQPLARPLVEEVMRQLARRGAYALLRLSYEPGAFNAAWMKEAPEELLREPSDIERYELENIDCFLAILAPENTHELMAIPQERAAMRQQAILPLIEPFRTQKKKWVGCYYPTNAVAQDAGMTLAELEEFLYGAVLIDWDALEREMTRIKERFDAADEARIVGDGTDLRMSLAGREGRVSGADANMPSGEVFYSPVEDSAEGEISFSEYPACYLGRHVYGVRLRFSGGRVVEASSQTEEEFLLGVLDTDEGARVLGELGIGCNPGIQRHMRNTLFDEKIEGTVHVAVGSGFPFIGGKNVSAVHWDMVKELRRGGRIELDGEVVQQDGRWLF